MQANRRLSEVLPVRFRNGEQIRQFSKPCIHCGKMLTSQHMFGVACLLNEHIAIAARANCPSCGEQFPVTCLINQEKQVKRVIVPYWVFNPFLRMQTAAEQERAMHASPDVMSDMLTPEEAPPVMVPAAPVDIERAEEAVGRYQDKPIPAWIRVNGKQLTFDRVAFEARAAENEFLLDGYLIYRG